MRTLTFSLILAIGMIHNAEIASAGIVADSASEFSGTQGENGWSYGFFDNTNLTGYLPSGFKAFDSFSAGVWKASDSITPGSLNNNDFLSLNSLGGHPNGVGGDGIGQDRILWAVRRYTSEVSGAVRIDYDLRKQNISEPRGGGVTGRILIDGVSFLDQFVANADSTGYQGSLFVTLNVGSKVDFAIDSLGVLNGNDGPFSARADGSIFTSTISTVPEPSSLILFGLSGLLLAYRGIRKRATSQI